jgi:3-oxoacyl-[acyl-carrier protein] reductase
VTDEARLEGRVALVTGGGRGIGRAIAVALGSDGADIAISYRRDEAAARDTVSAIESLGRRAGASQASVDVLDDDERLVAGVLDDFGGVDILVNNAGIVSRGQTVADTDPAEIDRL